MKMLCFKLNSNEDRHQMQDFPSSTKSQSLQVDMEKRLNNEIIEGNNKNPMLPTNNLKDSYVQLPQSHKNSVKDFKPSSISSIYKNTSFNSFSEINPDRESEERMKKEEYYKQQFMADVQQYSFRLPISPTLHPGQYRSNSNSFFENLESYSSLNSPTIKSSLHFIDENINPSCYYNSKDLQTSFSLRFQDTVTMILPPFNNRKRSIVTDLSLNTSEFDESTKVDNSIFRPFTNNRNNSNSSIQSLDDLNDHHLFGLTCEQYEHICNDVKVIVKSLKYVQKFQENKENVSRIFSEWRSVGLVLDRLFFFCYLFTVIFSILMYFPKIYIEE